MKNTFKKLVCVLTCTFILFSCELNNDDDGKSKNIEINESLYLTIAEHAYLEGYRAGLLGKNIDTTWIDLSKRYVFLLDKIK